MQSTLKSFRSFTITSFIISVWSYEMDLHHRGNLNPQSRKETVAVSSAWAYVPVSSASWIVSVHWLSLPLLSFDAISLIIVLLLLLLLLSLLLLIRLFVWFGFWFSSVLFLQKDKKIVKITMTKQHIVYVLSNRNIRITCLYKTDINKDRGTCSWCHT